MGGICINYKLFYKCYLLVLIIYENIYTSVLKNDRLYIFIKPLLSYLGMIVLKLSLEGVKIFYKLENQLPCIKIILNNINAKLVTHNTLNDNIASSAILFSTPGFIKKSVPFLHGK